MRRLLLALVVTLATGGCWDLAGSAPEPTATAPARAKADKNQPVAPGSPADEPSPDVPRARDGFGWGEGGGGEGERRAAGPRNGPVEAKKRQKLGGKGLAAGSTGVADKETANNRFEVLEDLKSAEERERTVEKAPPAAFLPRGAKQKPAEPTARRLAHGAFKDAPAKAAPDGGLEGLLAALEAEDGELDGRLRAALGPATTGVALDLGRLRLDGAPVEAAGDARPEAFLPRMCYFENTYLGGNAAYEERLRRLEADLGGQPGPHLLALLDPQPFDPPEDAGLRLTAALSQASLEKPGRVVLQVGLQGSRRHGWRRPPLDVALVVDVASPEVVMAAADALLKRLGPQDRLAILQVGDDEPVSPLADRRDVRTTLVRRADGLQARAGDTAALAETLARAGALLAGADDQARVPGTRTLVVVTDRGGDDRVEAAEDHAHALALTGVVTSVVAMGGAADQAWWRVASAGNGNLHRAGDAADLAPALEAELASLARVIARLLRVNVRLAPGVEAIRVIGSRVLGQEEVVAVKAREVATDQNLSRALGVKADRGDDDDGIQTVIPYFYGGDSHVILIELWAEKPGAVAEISLKYKDMVSLGNAVARTSVALSALPRGESAAQRMVQRNLEGFSFAEALRQGARLVQDGQAGAVVGLLRRSAQTPEDRQVAQAFADFVPRALSQDRQRELHDALALAADRRIGASGAGGRAR